MLEILFLIWFVKKLAGMATAKRRSGGWGAIGWVGGEIGGFVVGIAAGADGLGAYPYALFGAIACSVAAYLIVRSLSELPPADFPTARVV